MAEIDRILEELLPVRFDAPVLTVTLDLSPGVEGIPSAAPILKQGWREVEERHPLEHDALRSYQEDQRVVIALLDEAIARGSMGLYYAGCAAEGWQFTLETPFPLRNTVRLGERPAVFELVRYAYLFAQPVVLATVESSGMRAVRFETGEPDETVEMDEWEGAVTGPHGRTDTQGVGSSGSDGGGPSPSSAAGGPASDTAGGWHGKTRIEKSILAHRAAFQREHAGSLEELAGADDILLIAGPEEPRAELLRQLPEQVRARVIEAPNLDPTIPEARLAEDVRALAVSAQQMRAEEELRRLQSGDLGARAIGGAEAVRKAVEAGQLGTLVVPDDAAPDLGTARDARVREGLLDPDVADDLVRGALSVSAQCLFTRSRSELSDLAGAPVMGLLRWL